MVNQALPKIGPREISIRPAVIRRPNAGLCADDGVVHGDAVPVADTFDTSIQRHGFKVENLFETYINFGADPDN